MRRAPRLRSQNRILLRVLLAALPLWLLSLWWVFDGGGTAVRWLLFGTASLFLLALAYSVRRRVVYPLQSLANLLEALREGDYSLRGRNADPDDAFGEVMVEVNSLSRTLHHQRLEALEAGMLLHKVIAEVDMSVFAFDGERRLRMVNRAGERLLGEDADALRGRTASQLGFDNLLDRPSGTIVSHVFPSASGRWEVRHRSFRQGGLSHEMMVISDLSRALRDEERQAWQRLVRVIGHELNNSLAPIKSMASTLRDLIARDPMPDDWRQDAESALGVIGERAGSLERFMGAYARLARLPAPRPRGINFAALVQRTVSLQGMENVVIEHGPAVELRADPDQLEQALINLLKNAHEAVADEGGIRIRWFADGDWLDIEIEDDGPGLARTDNLWVPFYTTKPGGSGIGLVLSREIVENHGGSIALANRERGRGCIARLRLPCTANG